MPGEIADTYRDGFELRYRIGEGRGSRGTIEMDLDGSGLRVVGVLEELAKDSEFAGVPGKDLVNQSALVDLGTSPLITRPVDTH